MSQYHPDPMAVEYQERPSNPMGIVGFILAFCLSPIGLVLSAVSLAWKPRGFAIAGVVIGLIGTAIWVVIGLFVLKGVQMVRLTEQVWTDVSEIHKALESKKTADGAYPADLASLGLDPAITIDPWNNAYSYELLPDGTNYIVTSNGPDGQLSTEDDLLLDRHAREETIAVAAGAGFASMFGQQGSTYFRVIVDIARLQATLDSYRDEHHRYPETLESMPGMSPKLLTDPWGSPYSYAPTADGKGYRMSCLGADKTADTNDDLDSKDFNFDSPRRRGPVTIKVDPPVPAEGEAAEPAEGEGTEAPAATPEGETKPSGT